ncbi:MAG: OmpA-OmpF porin, family [Thermoanaerobaculia bacterium]|jgi:outer membrane protein OmpA-like peptidoglycan-associated protein|nr:OmpA-OmpF porin, family [Thermoanaerobaculia bacterium]
MRRLIAVLSVAAVVFACGKKEAAPPAPASSDTSAAASTSAAAATASTTTGAATDTPNLISFSSGALIVQKPQEYSEGWSAFWLLDDKATSGWATPENSIAPQTIVIVLPERTQLDRLSFDTGSIDGDGRGAKDVTVEMSDTSATSGFQQIAAVSLQDKADNQSFAVSAPVPGRWLRVVVKNNHGSPQYIELMEIRGFGRQLTQTPFADASGTYETNYGKFHLKQEGTSVTGCYEHGDGLLNGGIEGRVMKFMWSEGKDKSGPAIMVFSPDGKQMFGLWWYEGQSDANGNVWNGTKISNEIGSCPHWSGTGAEAQMTKDLEELGRTRIYGINFDTDSDTIKPESKPTLDKITALMKAKPDWKLRVEGHTDSSGNDAHNNDLSQKRAASVRAYLVTAGIADARLTPAGLGSTQPAATNTTVSGRAQNRRVELAKE